MDEINEMNEQPAVEEVLKKESYTPRPKWQIVLAWVGIGIVVTGFALYLYHIATAGGI